MYRMENPFTFGFSLCYNKTNYAYSVCKRTQRENEVKKNEKKKGEIRHE